MGILRALLGLPPTYSQRARRDQRRFRVQLKNSFRTRPVGTCFGCGGSGRFILKRRGGNISVPCRRCNGTGWHRF
jgi:DnaJ-class molecular chaperone